MARDVHIDWKGDDIAKRVRAASLVGLNATMGKCVTSAKGLVHVDTTVLQGSIRMEPAVPTPTGATGRWGSFDVNYALWQEVLPGERGGKAYLRPSADAFYGTLGSAIQRAL